MEREPERDRLLAQWLIGRRGSAPERLAPLLPLLDAASALTPLREATPDAAFVRQLEGSVLRRARQALGRDQPLAQEQQGVNHGEMRPTVPPSPAWSAQTQSSWRRRRRRRMSYHGSGESRPHEL
jgi:hypothetical protein